MLSTWVEDSWPTRCGRTPRVVSMERTHAGRLDPASDDPLELPEPVGLAVADVSFISLTRRAARASPPRPRPGGDIVPLVKPQFELSPREVPRGVVRDPASRPAAVERIREHAAGLGLEVLAEAESVLVGPSGNHEFFLHLRVPGGRRWRRRVRRIGFAFNPTQAEAIELRERALAWCAANGVEAWAVAGRRPPADAEHVRRRRRPSSCSVATARSCERLARWPTSVCPSSASTWARSASSPRPSTTTSRPVLELLARRRVRARAAPHARGPGPAPPAAAPADDVHIALNEAAVVRGAHARVMRVVVDVGDSRVATYVCDGVVVASPTGSTGYSFSAGGPIVEPTSRNLVVTPDRGLPDAAALERRGPAARRQRRASTGGPRLRSLSIDGRDDIPLAVGDRVEVRARQKPIDFIQPRGALPFWDLLRQKAELLPRVTR